MMRWIVLTMLLVPFMASAADFWDGNAALQRGDADFESGLNVTSNSFPPGTQITILNEDTGKTVTATVTGRIEGQSDILMLMSPKTAAALGVSQGNLGRVRVTVPAGTDAAAAAQPGDQTVSRDPDVNPAASAAAAPEAAAATTAIAQTPDGASASPAAESGTPAAESPAAETPAVETPAGEAPAAETPAEETPAATAAPTEETMPAATPAETAQTAPAATPEVAPDQTGTAEQPSTAAQAATPASGEDADAAAILSQAEARNPQKEMFQPPREDQKFVYHPETTPAQTGTVAPASGATVASVSEPAVIPPASAQGELPLADVTAPEESRPQEIVGAGTAVPPAAAPETALAAPEVAPAGETAVAQAPTQTEVIGQGAAPPAGSPPAAVALAAPVAPAAAPAATPTGTTTAATTSTTIASATTPSTTGTVTPRQPTAVAASATSVPRTGPGTFYLQLAAYGSEKGARDLAAKLAPTYPAIVLAPASSGSSTFKVVIGPLNKAESGTLLLWFRYRGFPDAFLKQQ